MAGYIGSKASVVSSGVERKKTYSITGSTTSLTGLNYTVGKVHVYQNGVRLLDGTDYTATNGTSITLTVAAQNGDNVVVVSQASFQLSESYTSTEADAEFVTKTGDTMSGGLTVQGTVAATAVTGDGSGLTGLPAGVGGANGVIFNDNVKAQFGAGNDLQIYHNGGSGNYIDSVNKDLYIRCNLDAGIVGGDIVLQPKSGENSAVFRDNGAVELYYDNALKLATTATGVDVTGGVTTNSYSYLNGLRISGADTGNTVYQQSGDLSISSASGAISLKPSGANILHATNTGVGIGTSSPNATLTVSQSANNIFAVERTGVSSGSGQFGINVEGNSQTTVSYDDGAQLVFGTASSPSTHTGFTERMRIDSSGDLLLGTTSADARLSVYDGTSWAGSFGRQGGGTHGVIRFTHDGTQVGYIAVSSTATSYVTSSDYRLKENVVDLTGASARVNQLNPSRFNFIADGTDTVVDGFLAHEVADVVPEAIAGTHNEVEVWKDDEELPDGVSAGDNKLDDDGNTIPVYQGIDQSKLVPLLTAALQEALAEITSLKTRVEALEA